MMIKEMIMNKTTILLITIFFLGAACICRDEENDSLEAKQAKLEAEPIIKASKLLTAPPPPLGFEITADYLSKYIWRGQNISDDPVFQLGASIGWNGFALGWWSSIDTTKINGKSGEFTEQDWFLDYSGDLPFVEGVDYSLGVAYYYFPTVDNSGDTTEVYFGLGFDLPLSPSVTVSYDVDEIKGTYASFGIGHSIEKIAELTPDIPIAMNIGASLGWGQCIV